MIDACTHPVVASGDDIGAYLPREHQLQKLTTPGGTIYPIPIPNYVEGSVPEEFVRPPRAPETAPLGLGHVSAQASPLAGSDPKLFAQQVLEEPGADYAVLLPLTRGQVSDASFEATIATATNEWMADTWLGDWNHEGRFKGSIRVCPRTPEHAAKEIARWADHPHFVQVAIPRESHIPYGEQQFFPIWKAAAEHGLPVAIQSDNSGGVLLPPTPIGYPMYALEFYAQLPMFATAHIASLIGHGVFDRLESLRVVVADGGFDYMQYLMWRLDKDWRSARAEVPWMQGAPSTYVGKNIFFVVHANDGFGDEAEYRRFLEVNDAAAALVYGSNYPSWDYLAASELEGCLPEAARPAVMNGTARSLYGLQD